jgi:hypothetical protein
MLAHQFLCTVAQFGRPELLQPFFRVRQIDQSDWLPYVGIAQFGLLSAMFNMNHVWLDVDPVSPQNSPI